MSGAYLEKLIAKFDRVAIVGGPLTGKTTMAKQAPDGVTVIHGDDYIELGWSESSAALSQAANDVDGKVIIEGVQVARAIRKGMNVDALVVLYQPYRPQNKGQISMTKGIYSVLDDCTNLGLLDGVLVLEELGIE